MRLSNVIRFAENKSIDAARGIGRAAADFNHAVKTEYAKRREQRLVEQAEILARAQLIVAEKFAAQQRELAEKMLAELEAQDAAIDA